MHCALPLCLVQLGMLLHQEDASPRFPYEINTILLTRVVGMLIELLEPSVGDGYALTFWVIFTHLEALAGSIMDDVRHVLLPQSTQYTKEELALWQLVGELLFGGEVLCEHRVFHSILIEVLYRELLVARDVEADHFVLLEVQLLVGQNVSHEAELGTLHRGQEHVHYDNVVIR
jgi:hypothetical protein